MCVKCECLWLAYTFMDEFCSYESFYRKTFEYGWKESLKYLKKMFNVFRCAKYLENIEYMLHFKLSQIFILC